MEKDIVVTIKNNSREWFVNASPKIKVKSIKKPLMGNFEIIIEYYFEDFENKNIIWGPKTFTLQAGDILSLTDTYIKINIDHYGNLTEEGLIQALKEKLEQDND